MAILFPRERISERDPFPSPVAMLSAPIAHPYNSIEALLAVRKSGIVAPMIRTGIGYDSHRLTEGRRLVIGGVAIPHCCGLAGHSDADVLIHALCDALLGAVADGDIGQHFSDRDAQWKDADSTLLLRRVSDRLMQAGWRILNTDATVVYGIHALVAYVPAMRARLAEVMGIEPSRVSVKAKSNEGMDAVGRREGIVAMAVATVCRTSATHLSGDQ